MIRTLVVLLAVLSFFCVGAADAVAAGCKPPESYVIPSGPDVYVVWPGDTGWDLADIYHNDPTLWHRVVKDNPKLAESWRMGTMLDGKPRLILCPGEPLRGLKAAGISPSSLKGGAGGPGGSYVVARLMRPLLPIEPQYGAFDRFVLGSRGKFLDYLLWFIAGAGVMAILIFIFRALDGFLIRQRRNAEPTETPR